MVRAKNVEDYIAATPEWAQNKLIQIRTILVGTSLKETIKWGAPTYVGKTNVVGLGAFKNFVSVWFYQGVFLVDEHRVLVAAQDETKGLRQWRFYPDDEVKLSLLEQYVNEAILNDTKGMKIKPSSTKKPVEIPQQLEDALNQDQRARESFEKMSPSHQREYCEYIAEAKKEETKQRRVAKCLKLIQQNAGLNDKYKK